MNYLQKILPLSILTVGASGLTFQAIVLEPYHKELDAEFK